MVNDLISREALKKQVQELLDLAGKRVDDTPNNSPCYRMYVAQENERARFIKLIDNAPTVEPEKILVANVTFDKDELNRLIDERVIEPIKNGELVLQTDERTQGEWGKWIVAEIQCPNCFEYFETDCYSTGELNKCPNCGADLKGGEDNR